MPGTELRPQRKVSNDDVGEWPSPLLASTIGRGRIVSRTTTCAPVGDLVSQIRDTWRSSKRCQPLGRQLPPRPLGVRQVLRHNRAGCAPRRRNDVREHGGNGRRHPRRQRRSFGFDRSIEGSCVKVAVPRRGVEDAAGMNATTQSTACRGNEREAGRLVSSVPVQIPGRIMPLRSQLPSRSWGHLDRQPRRGAHHRTSRNARRTRRSARVGEFVSNGSIPRE
jgi:hypothetical protein